MFISIIVTVRIPMEIGKFFSLFYSNFVILKWKWWLRFKKKEEEHGLGLDDFVDVKIVI